MRYGICASVILFAFQNVLAAQQGVAENGYYPPTYSGTIFIGNLTSANDDTRETTLTYTNPGSGKTETFVGILEDGYMIEGKDGTLRDLKPSNLKLGARIKVYYMAKTKKVDGKKVKINSIFLIGGLPNRGGKYVQFKAFSGNR